MPKKKKSKAESKIEDIDRKIQTIVDEIVKIREGRPCYPLLSPYSSIGADTVDKVYEELSKDSFQSTKKLDVILESGGGNIDSAYNLSQLLRKIGSEELTFIIPRWAKSAATLVACSGDRILLTPVAELGPIDPQITQIIPAEKRTEKFSPLHIDSTLELIRNEYEKGNSKLADKLMERLQFPLTLGSFKKYLEIGEDYTRKLLESRMLQSDPQKARTIAKKLTSGYPDHSYCLNTIELKELGLIVEELDGNLLDHVWQINCLVKERHRLLKEMKEQEILEKLKNIPPELLKSLPDNLVEKLTVPNESLNVKEIGDRMDQYQLLTIKLAALLLLREGQISLIDIECLPFVDDPEKARAIADRLSEVFDVGRRQVKRGTLLSSDWETIIHLKSAKPLQASRAR